VTQIYLPWVYLTQYGPLTGFLNLLAVFSLNHPMTLFHATSTYGFHPPESSPQKQHQLLVEANYLANGVSFLQLPPPA